jgi:hypothetical protein
LIDKRVVLTTTTAARPWYAWRRQAFRLLLKHGPRRGNPPWAPMVACESFYGRSPDGGRFAPAIRDSGCNNDSASPPAEAGSPDYGRRAPFIRATV